ncbi:MAG: FAD-dependent oxidoreductase [Candidatus Omnitrophota bacterium]
MKEAIVVGGGISGITCAWHLSRAGYQVTVLEKEPVLGGLARSFLSGDTWVPLAYHHLMAPDKTTKAYISNLGLKDKLRWIKSSQVFWYEGRDYLLSEPQHIFGFKPLSLRGRWRLFNLGLYTWLKKDWDSLKGIDCDSWLDEVAGKEVKELLFQNLMDIKFNMPLSSVSAAWLGRRMHQSIKNRDRYGYLACGWQGLIDKMAQGIKENHGKVFTGFEAQDISYNKIEGLDNRGIRISLSADMIVSTLPPPVFNNILNVPDKSSLLLKDIRYKPMISFVCASKKDISPYYWSVVLKPHLIFGGFFNHTTLTASLVDGNYIYYFFTYLEDSDPLWQKDEAKIKEEYLADIRRLFPDFTMEWHKIFKIRFSQPVFARGYINPAIELNKGIYLAGVYRQFPKPRTMDAAFYSGEETARYIIGKERP